MIALSEIFEGVGSWHIEFGGKYTKIVHGASVSYPRQGESPLAKYHCLRVAKMSFERHTVNDSVASSAFFRTNKKPGFTPGTITGGCQGV